MTRRRWTVLLAVLVVVAALTSSLRARRKPSAYPHGQSFFLELPRPLLSRSRLLNILAPSPGERLLEVGPGTGYYSLDVAQHIEPGGTLDILDLQEAMLTTTIAKARERRIDNLIPTPGSAQTLPYPDASFDGAFLVAVLGEVPDKNAALLELRRVLKRGGRLVVGEGQPDPHMVGFAELVERATRGGFQFEERSGGRLGYVACFRAV